MDQVTLNHTHQGYIVEGAGLPAGACWNICETYAEALKEAHELAEDFGLPVVETRAVAHALVMGR